MFNPRKTWMNHNFACKVIAHGAAAGHAVIGLVYRLVKPAIIPNEETDAIKKFPRLHNDVGGKNTSRYPKNIICYRR